MGDSILAMQRTCKCGGAVKARFVSLSLSLYNQAADGPKMAASSAGLVDDNTRRL